MAPPNRPADLPKSTNDTACFFFWLQNIRDCILLLVDISWWKSRLFSYLRIGRKQVDFGREREFSRWFWFKWKVQQNGRFLARKTSEKGLFYRLNSNLFIFKQFTRLHRKVFRNTSIYNTTLRHFSNERRFDIYTSYSHLLI